MYTNRLSLQSPDDCTEHRANNLYTLYWQRSGGIRKQFVTTHMVLADAQPRMYSVVRYTMCHVTSYLFVT